MKSDLEIIVENHKPPTLFQICESICYTNETPSRIMNLGEKCHETIFQDVDYPLTSKIDRAEFQIKIVNHFLLRRIGQETLRAFQVVLRNKLNEIMPYYNKLFDMLEGWDIFGDGEIVTRTNENNTETKSDVYSNTTSENSSDRRYSNMPDNRIVDVKNGSYLTDYNYDTNKSGSDNVTIGNGSSKSNDIEKITRTPADKLSLYKEFMDNQKSIYTKLFQDLESCFYALVD